MRVVLAWTDYPGKFLHNNLELCLEGPAGIARIGNGELMYHRDPFGTDGMKNASAPKTVQLLNLAFDKYNNVEVLSVHKPQVGIYRVWVLAQYTDPAQKAQGYAICVCGELESTTLS